MADLGARLLEITSDSGDSPVRSQSNVSHVSEPEIHPIVSRRYTLTTLDEGRKVGQTPKQRPENTDIELGDINSSASDYEEQKPLNSVGENGHYVIPELQDARKYMEAAIFLLEAEHYGTFDFHPRNEKDQRLFLYMTSWKHLVLEIIVALIYMSIVLFEEPAVYLLDPRLTGAIELICTFLFIVNLYLKSKICGGIYNFFYPVDYSTTGFNDFLAGRSDNGRRVAWGNVMRLLIAIAMMISGALTIALGSASYLSIIRPLLILDVNIMQGCRRVLRQIVMSIFYIRWMMILLLLFILISSVLAFHFFSPNLADPTFATLEDSFVNLFILMTTANYPDVMMKAFNWTQAAPIFFTLYLFFGLYTIFNIFIAFVFGFYQEQERNKFKTMYLRRRRAIRLAYYCAEHSSESGLTMRAFREIVKLYKPSMSVQDVVLAFAIMDTSRDGALELSEFYNFYNVSNIRWKIDYMKSIGQLDGDYDYLPTKGWSQWRIWIRSFVLSRVFKWFIILVIVGNVVYMVVEAVLERRNSKGDIELSEDVIYIFYAIFLAEAILKILGLGVSAYFSKGWNVFDFLIVFTSTLFFIIEEAAGESPVGLFSTVVRGFRLARIFKTQSTFKKVTEVIAFLFPKMMRFIGALLIVYYFFSVIGMLAFANTVSQCGIECDGGSSYYDHTSGLHFQLNCFDNILYSYNTLFELMVVNNWFVIMNGHVYKTGRAARIYFFVYFLVMVIVVSNIVIAFILDAFQTLFDLRSDSETDELQSIKGDIELPVEQEVAAQFLPEDNKALANDVVYFVGHKRRVAIYNILYRDDMTEWDREDDIKFASDHDSVM